jgi:replicative superfamily II helicase
MQSVDMSALKQLDNDFERILRKVPNARREMHDEIGAAVLKDVRAQISHTGMNNPGKIADMQVYHVGSSGGYAAVRAVEGTGPTGQYNDSPGAITNYLENGHKIRKPSGKAKNYKPRINKPYVDGYHFYAEARRNADAVAIKAADKYASKIADMLEGKT